jgi:hypothetical protein
VLVSTSAGALDGEMISSSINGVAETTGDGAVQREVEGALGRLGR